MDRFDAMATLVAAVDGGSLSAASRALGMPLATVSRKVSELEGHLRTQLVIRTSRKLVLTEAGLAYVAASRRILDEIEDAERTASGEYRAPRGHLTITAPVVFGRLHVEPVLLEFLKAYPEINARLVLADHVVNLVDDQVDVAIRIGLLPDSSMFATRLGAVGWVTCASPQYLEARGTPETPAALERHDCIMFEGVYSNNLWSFGRGKEAMVLPSPPALFRQYGGCRYRSGDRLRRHYPRPVISGRRGCCRRRASPDPASIRTGAPAGAHCLYRAIADAAEAPCVSRFRRTPAKGVDP